MGADDISEARQLREKGNTFFKSAQLDSALESYSQGLKVVDPSDRAERSALLKNRAAVHLRLQQFDEAETDCTDAIQCHSADAKVLLRRSQARRGLGRLADAITDAKAALSMEPANRAVTQHLQQLAVEAQQQQREATSVETRVKQMTGLVLDGTADAEKRMTATNNLVVLARESTVGADLIFATAGFVDSLFKMITESSATQSTEQRLGYQRVLDELAKQEKKANQLMERFGTRAICALLDSKERELSDAAQAFVQRLFNALAAMNRNEQKKADEEVVERNKLRLVDLIFELKRLMYMEEGKQAGIAARENAMDLLSKNLMWMDGGLPKGWSWRFMDDNGLERILKVAASIPEIGFVPVGPNTREHVAVFLTRLFEDMNSDQRRGDYEQRCTNYVAAALQDNSRAARIALFSGLTTLLMGPFDVGFKLVGNQNLTEPMLNMAATEDPLQQRVALEAIVYTAGKQDRCGQIISNGIPVLKKLYESADPHIKARALVGLCKCSVSSGGDISRTPMAEGSTDMLFKMCRKFLLDPSENLDLRRWAAEGLSYLTIDAEIKEQLSVDKPCLEALVELCERAGAICVYGAATIFVNMMNMYDMPNPEPELVKLAQFSKHHVPTKHPKDEDDFVEQRVKNLVAAGVIAACVSLGKAESPHSRELLARSLFAMSKDKENRGSLVHAGTLSCWDTLHIVVLN